MTANELRAWRKALGWSQSRAAQALGVSLRAYQDRENGTAAVRHETALACAWVKLYGEADPWSRAVNP